MRRGLEGEGKEKKMEKIKTFPLFEKKAALRSGVPQAHRPCHQAQLGG